MNAKTIDRAAKLDRLADVRANPNENERNAARARFLAVLEDSGMSERLFRVVMKHRRPVRA